MRRSDRDLSITERKVKTNGVGPEGHGEERVLFGGDARDFDEKALSGETHVSSPCVEGYSRLSSYWTSSTVTPLGDSLARRVRCATPRPTTRPSRESTLVIP